MANTIILSQRLVGAPRAPAHAVTRTSTLQPPRARSRRAGRRNARQRPRPGAGVALTSAFSEWGFICLLIGFTVAYSLSGAPRARVRFVARGSRSEDPPGPKSGVKSTA